MLLRACCFAVAFVLASSVSIPTSAEQVVATIPVGSNPLAVGVNSVTNRIYVANFSSHSVSVIDGGSNSVIATVPVGSYPHGAAVDASTNRVYVTNYIGASVSVIDGATNTVIATIPVGNLPRGIAIDSAADRVYVSTRDGHTLTVIDTASNAVVSVVPAPSGSYPLGIDVNPVTGRVYMGINPAGLMVYDIAGATTSFVGTGGTSPRGVSIDASRNRVYVANNASSTLGVIDGATGALVTAVATGAEPYGVCYNPGSSRVYVANWSSNDVSVVDVAVNSVLSSVPVGTTPTAIGVNPATNRVYVTNYGANTVSVLAPSPGPVISTVSIAFDIYNQGRGGALPSQVRAVLSDHSSLAGHQLGTGRDNPVDLALAPPPDCEGSNCTPALAPGQSAHYTGAITFPAGGLGRLLPAGNSIENDDGSFTVTSSSTTSSRVRFEFGRYLWVEADSERDGDGQKIDASGQKLAELLANDAQRIFVAQTAPALGDLAHLSATFDSVTGGSGGGTPRIEVWLQDHGKIAIRLGSAGTFSDSDATLDAWSGVNLIGNADPGRYDTSGLTGVAPELVQPSTTWATADLAAGTFIITHIDFVADAAPEREYVLTRIDVAASPD